ncbi:hypothetical protein ACFL6U_22155 [Planctomycetota bacterium]
MYKTLTTRSKVALIAGAAALALCTGVAANTLRAKNISQSNSLPVSASIDPICTLQLQLTPEYTPGEARFTSLADYFRNANPPLFHRTARLVAEYRSGKHTTGATYVAGSSGVGKSFIISQLGLPHPETAGPIKLSEVFNKYSPDLQSLDGIDTFNSLPSTDSFSLLDLLDTHNATGKVFVLLDDLDEVHPDTALNILKSIEAYVQAPDNPSTHFMVFGRPEAFGPWLTSADRTLTDSVTDQPILLFGPDYQTTGDLDFRCQQYYQWKYQVDGEHIPVGLCERFRAQLRRYPFLKSTIRPLSAGNFVLDDVIVSHANTAPQKSIQEIREGLFHNFLARNATSHNRPGADDNIYTSLLEKAAVFPLLNHRTLSPRGAFEVLATDTLDYHDPQGIKRTVRLQDVLSRAGVALLDPSDPPHTRYRFEPLWVHAHLIEKWNQRHHPNHRYRWCHDENPD